MFSFVAFRDWILQAILLKFFSSYDSFILDPIPSEIPVEIIREILLWLPPKSILKFMCVSKSWLQLISSPDFVNAHLKLNSNHHHKVLFPGSNGSFKFSSLPPLFNKDTHEDLVNLDFPFKNPTSIVGSANGLICLFNRAMKLYLWNPTINKSKEILNFTCGFSFYDQYGFGYDQSHDDYKALFVDYHRLYNTYNWKTVVNIYSLRTDSWRTVHEHHDIYLASSSGIFINGKIYWASSAAIDNDSVFKIISFDVADETWERLELPVCGRDNSHFKLGAVGSDLSLLYSCLGATTSDVWIMKNCGVNASWTKSFTIKYPQIVGLHMCSLTIYTFAIHFRQSNKGDFLLFLHSNIMIYDGETRQLKHIGNVEGCDAGVIYVESLVNPLKISDQGRPTHATSQYMEAEANVEHYAVLAEVSRSGSLVISVFDNYYDTLLIFLVCRI